MNFWQSESCQGLAPPPDVTVSSLKWCYFEADRGTCQIEGTEMKGGVWEGERERKPSWMVEDLGRLWVLKGVFAVSALGWPTGVKTRKAAAGGRARLCPRAPRRCPAWLCPGRRSCSPVRLLCCGCNNGQGLAHDAKIGVGCNTEVDVS